MKLAIDIQAETYKAISEWDEPKTKYAAEYMLYQFVKNGKRIEQTNCTDAISRSEAIRIASGYCHWTNIPAELAKLPSVCTEKTGRWKEVQFRTIPYNRISKAKKCSVCGKRKDKYVTWNYCPNCGAKMEVEE